MRRPIGGRIRLRTLAAAILVFNVIDGMLTLAVVDSGLATEANPLMARSLDLGPVHFMAIKVLMVSLGVYLLWELRSRRPAHLAIKGLAAMYGVLMLYHLRSLDALARYLQ